MTGGETDVVFRKGRLLLRLENSVAVVTRKGGVGYATESEDSEPSS